MAFVRNPVVYVPDLTNGRPIVDGKVYLLTAGTVPPTQDSAINPATLLTVTYVNEAGNTVERPQPLYTSKGGCLYGSYPSAATQYSVNNNSFVFAAYNAIGELQYSAETTGGDFVASDDLAATDSTVLVGGVEAGEIAANYNQADALLFPNGAFWDSPVLSERTMVDIKNFQGQDGTYPAKEPVIVHDYSDGRRTMQLDKVGGSAADYVLGLRRANNPINRPDKAADYVAPVGYLECSYDSFDGPGGSKLVNKSFYFDPNANLVWTGKNGSVVTSAQFITLKPNGDGRYPFWFTATQEQDLFMRFSNPSGDVLTIRDDVSGTRTSILVDSNQSSGLRISCLAGPLDLDAGTNITIRKPVNTAASTDLTLTPSRDLLLNPVSGSTKCDTPFRLRSYSVSSVPSATTFDQHLIYVTNGDAGQPCLAVAQGGVWKRIALGAAISST